MRHHATLLCAALMLMALAGAGFADQFEDPLLRHRRPLVPFPSPIIRSGAVGGLPSGVATSSVPTNISGTEAAPAPSAAIETSNREDCADGAENSDQKIANCSRVIADNTASTATRAQAYRSRGAAYYDQSDYDRAIADFSEAIKLDPSIVPPSFALAYNRRGHAYFEKKNYDSAIADYDEAITLDSSSAEVYLNRGTAYNGKQDYDRAIPDFDRALQLDPNSARAYNNRGFAYFRKNDTDRAIADYSEAVKHNPNYAIAYDNRGDAYLKKDDYDRAIADYSEAVRSNPNYAIAYNDRGNAYFKKNDYDRAIADYSEAVRSNPNYATGYDNRGFAYFRKNDPDRAIADYNEAIRLNPRFALAYRRRCDAYYSTGRYDAAIADCSEAVKLDPQDDFARTTLGLANAAKRDSEAVSGGEEVFRLQNNVLRLPVAINGVRGTFIMDTGATFVSMKRAFAEKAKVQIDQNSNVKLQTANGEVNGKRGRAATVQLRSLQAKDVVVVVQTDGQSTYGNGIDGLLGLSFLSRFKISIDTQTVKIANSKAK
jgi:clan AA aspartic protease (TIGR02281 family)